VASLHWADQKLAVRGHETRPGGGGGGVVSQVVNAKSWVAGVLTQPVPRSVTVSE
jgi:hypothetical protein